MKAFYFALMTAIIWGAVPVLEKLGLARIAPTAGVFIRFFGVVIGAVILAIFNNQALRTALKADPRTIFFLALGGFMASIVGQIFFYNALKTGEASKVVPIAGIYPLVSFLLGIIFLGECFTATKAAGVTFVILGLFFLR
ncbi:EamA family transporter [Candidatus Omnitrophota bacterium]